MNEKLKSMVDTIMEQLKEMTPEEMGAVFQKRLKETKRNPKQNGITILAMPSHKNNY